MATLEKRVEALEFGTVGNGRKVALLTYVNGILTPTSDDIRPMHQGESEADYQADARAGFDKVLTIVGVKPGEQHGNA